MSESQEGAGVDAPADAAPPPGEPAPAEVPVPPEVSAEAEAPTPAASVPPAPVEDPAPQISVAPPPVEAPSPASVDPMVLLKQARQRQRMIFAVIAGVVLVAFLGFWFGFKSNMPTPDGHTYEEAIVNTSLEQLSEINPQLIIRGKYADPGLTDSWVGQPLYDSIDAVKNGNVVDVTAHEWSRLRGVIASEVSAANLVEIVKHLKK